MVDSLDTRMKAAGMYTVSEILEGTPLDAFFNNPSVNSLDELKQWVVNEWTTYLKVQALHDLGDHILEQDTLDFILGKMAILRPLHVILKRIK